MRKIQDVLGLPVLDLGSGKKIGTIKDVYFNQEGELRGFAVDSHGILSRTGYLYYKDITAIGDDAVTIGNERFLQPIPSNQFYSFNFGKKPYKELPVVTTNGHELGYIKDVYFMEEMGKIIGYEISDGFLTDITEGRRTIKSPQSMIIGEDAIIVPKNQVNEVIFEGE